MTFGGYDLDKHAPNSTLTWNSLVDTTYWTVQLSQVQVNSHTIDLSTSKAILDTGTSVLVLPEPDFKQLMNFWSQKMRCFEDP